MIMYVLGFDIGGTKSAVLLAGVQENAIQMIDRREIPTVPDWRHILETLCGEAMRMARRAQVELKDCVAGVSCGGPLSADRRLVCSPPNLPGWDEVPVTEYLERRLGVPAHMENDADACALAEWRYGAGRGCRNMVFLTFGTGLGCGLILDGRLYRGTSGMAGEAGHIRMEPDGPVGYGKRGSLEGFCSGGGLRRLALLYIEEQRKRGRTPEFAGDAGRLTAKELAVAAGNGDPDAVEIFRICGREFGRGLSILIDLLNPERIIAGGIYARCHELLEETMYEEMEREALAGARRVCSVWPAQLGEQIGDYGAVMAGCYSLYFQDCL